MTLALIRQRQSLFRLAFDDRRVTRAMLRAQAVEFETWLESLDTKPDIRHGQAWCRCGRSVLPENWANHLLRDDGRPHGPEHPDTVR